MHGVSFEGEEEGKGHVLSGRRSWKHLVMASVLPVVGTSAQSWSARHDKEQGKAFPR